MSSPILQYFAYAHLPERLQAVSAAIANIAEGMELSLPDGPEKSAGLRKLLEAKDCFVRAGLGQAVEVRLPSAALIERIAYLERENAARLAREMSVQAPTGGTDGTNIESGRREPQPGRRASQPRRA